MITHTHSFFPRYTLSLSPSHSHQKITHAEKLITETHHSNAIDRWHGYPDRFLHSAEVVHIPHTKHLSYVKYNLAPHPQRKRPTTTHGTLPTRGPLSIPLIFGSEDQMINQQTRYVTQIPCPGQTSVRHTDPESAPGARCALPPSSYGLKLAR
jgi:hypothetical protein